MTNEIKINGIFHFHGLNLPVVQKGKKEFVPIKPIIDLLGINWQRAKKTLETDYKANFYQFCTLKVPPIEGFPILKYTEIPCISLQKVHFYLAQINPERIKSNGNIESADFLIKLHHEWADALYNYETHGIAINKDKIKTLKELMVLRNHAKGEEISLITTMINEELKGASFDSSDPQGQLPV